MDGGETQIVTSARHADVALESRAHCLELIEGFDFGPIFVMGAHGTTLGRTLPADILLNDSEVSRAHCRVVVVNDTLFVSDLGSTNGTFLDGVRITELTSVPVGSILCASADSLSSMNGARKGKSCSITNSNVS